MNFLYYWYIEQLSKYHLSEFVAMLTFPIIPFCVVAIALILMVLLLVLAERKILALFTQRKGPNRVGFWGCLQTVADAIKILCKENISVDKTDKFLFTIAPLLAFVPVIIVWGLIPYSAEFEFMSFSVSILLFLAVSLIPVMGIFLAGYASNNKYSMIGAIRSVAQVISYELPVMFVTLSVVLLSSSMNLKDIVMAQVSAFPHSNWFVIPCFIGFIIMFICTLCELNRCPFDLPEAESELVGGYHTEYSGMRFALFYLAEYSMLFVLCAFMATIFFGGFLPPFGYYVSELIFGQNIVSGLCIYVEQVIWLLIKTFVLIFLVMLIRATLPRLDTESLMKFSWNILLPLSILNFIVICVFKVLSNVGGSV